MQNDGHSWDDMGITTFEECIAHIKPYVLGGFYVFFALYVLLAIHFLWVVRSHYLNAMKPVEEGGCATRPPGSPGYQGLPQHED